MLGSRAEQERFEEFLEVWADLSDDVRRSEGVVVVVEGENDRRSLLKLGLAGPVVLVHQGRRLSAIAQALARSHRRAIVLTDWDRKGGQLAERLATLLNGDEVKVDLETRQRLARVLRGELVHVEGLFQWASNLADSVGVALAMALEQLSG